MSESCNWTGKVQSVNRWHGARAIKTGNKYIAMIYEKVEYKSFKKSLAKTFSKMNKLTGYVDLIVTMVLSSRADTGNLDKPIGDALEDAGIIENDKYIRNITYYRHYHPNSGTKNKFDDFIQVRLIKVIDDEIDLIEHQKKNDDFNLRNL